MRHSVAALALGAVALATVPLGAAGPESAPLAPQVQIETPIYGAPTSNAPLPIGSEHDVYCSGFLGSLDQPFSGTIASAEYVEARSIYMQPDIVYIDIGEADGVMPGQEFWVVRPDQVIYRWGSVTDELGRLYKTQARLRVICVQAAASIAELTRSCDDVEVGDRLMPFEPVPIPLVKRTRPLTSCDPPSGKLAGHIVEVKDRAVPVATASVVYLDLGDSDGLVAGDFLNVYRTRAAANGVRTMLGEVAILKTESHSAVAIVTTMSDVMYAGDEVELK
jgi:hypothetical protein